MRIVDLSAPIGKDPSSPPSVNEPIEIKARRWEGLLTSAGAVSVVNSVVGGVFAALAVQVFIRPDRTIPVATGVVFATVIGLGFLRHEATRWRRAEEMAPARFARSGEEPGA